MVMMLIQLIEKNPNVPIAQVISHFYPVIDFVEDEDRIYLANKTICIAKTKEGNLINLHEWYCSTLLSEYIIQFYPCRRPFLNFNYGVIIKPTFQKFDRTAANSSYYIQILAANYLGKGVVNKLKDNQIGILNGRLVLTDYSNFIPFIFWNFPLTCSCGHLILGSLEPFCLQCGIIDLNKDSTLNIIDFSNKDFLQKHYLGGF